MTDEEIEARAQIAEIRAQRDDLAVQAQNLRAQFDDSADDFDDEEQLRALQNEVNRLDRQLLSYPPNWLT
jgi:uncharacterized coiled-coil DUF342 family protein